MFSLLGVINTFPAERAVFLRETQDKLYHPAAFYFSKVAVDTVMQCAFPLLVLAIAYPLIGLNAESAERVLLFYVASWPVSAYNFSPFRLFGLPSSTLSNKWSEKRPLPFVFFGLPLSSLQTRQPLTLWVWGSSLNSVRLESECGFDSGGLGGVQQLRLCHGLHGLGGHE